MASKSGKWREFGKKGEKSGENSIPLNVRKYRMPQNKKERNDTPSSAVGK